MDRKVLDAVLNSWKIRDESERWSLISMFVRHHGEEFTREDFNAFLERVYQSPIKYRYTSIFSEKL
jgi:type VI protein secretion system component VasF